MGRNQNWILRYFSVKDVFEIDCIEHYYFIPDLIWIKVFAVPIKLLDPGISILYNAGKTIQLNFRVIQFFERFLSGFRSLVLL